MNYINPHKINETLWVCDCGKQFKSCRSLSTHARFCDKYKKVKKQSKYKINNEYICECGYKTLNYQSLNCHFSHCDIHCNCIGRIRKLRPSEINHSMCWENKSKKEISEIHYKSAAKRKDNIKNGISKPSFEGKHHTEESKCKIRKSTIKYLSELVDDFTARYNKNACKFIDNINKEHGWNLQHAENGGEIKCCGYFLDGYDKELNIVFEYDEAKHYEDINNNILKAKDIIRQQNIINELHCEFWRYNESLDLLYKVN